MFNSTRSSSIVVKACHKEVYWELSCLLSTFRRLMTSSSATAWNIINTLTTLSFSWRCKRRQFNLIFHLIEDCSIAVKRWFAHNGLLLNANKSDVMFTGTPAQLSTVS